MRGGKAYWAVLAVLLAVAVGGTVRLYSLAALAGTHWPFLDRPGSLTHEIRLLAEKLPLSITDLELARDLLPDADAGAAEAVRLAAEASGVDIGEAFPLSQAPGGEAFRRIEFHLAPAGSYGQIAHFINCLEGFGPGAAKRLFSVESFDIASGGGGRHQAAIVAETFAYDAEAPKPAAGEAETASLESLIAGKAFVYAGGGLDPLATPNAPQPSRARRTNDANK